MKKNIFVLCLTGIFLTVFVSGQEPDAPKVFTDLIAAMADPLSVEHLELKKKGLKIFPAEISRMKNLKTLNLSKNKIK